MQIVLQLQNCLSETNSIGFIRKQPLSIYVNTDTAVNIDTSSEEYYLTQTQSLASFHTPHTCCRENDLIKRVYSVVEAWKKAGPRVH